MFHSWLTFRAGSAPAALNTSICASPHTPSAVVTRRPKEYVDPTSRLSLGRVTMKSLDAPA